MHAGIGVATGGGRGVETQAAALQAKTIPTQVIWACLNHVTVFQAAEKHAAEQQCVFPRQLLGRDGRARRGCLGGRGAHAECPRHRP